MTLVLAWECFIFYFSFYHGEVYISLYVWGINVAFHLQKSNQSCIKMDKMKQTFHLLFLISLIYLNVSVGKQCKTAGVSIPGKALMGYTFKSLVVRAPFECQVLCENTFHCQRIEQQNKGGKTSKLCHGWKSILREELA